MWVSGSAYLGLDLVQQDVVDDGLLGFCQPCGLVQPAPVLHQVRLDSICLVVIMRVFDSYGRDHLEGTTFVRAPVAIPHHRGLCLRKIYSRGNIELECGS